MKLIKTNSPMKRWDICNYRNPPILCVSLKYLGSTAKSKQEQTSGNSQSLSETHVKPPKQTQPPGRVQWLAARRQSPTSLRPNPEGPAVSSARGSHRPLYENGDHFLKPALTALLKGTPGSAINEAPRKRMLPSESHDYGCVKKHGIRDRY